ncbi:hypothetical protein CLV89_102134 [Tritonibacter scottomollicae]|uniref:Uncharacterized protein n=1 Tax=Tritonibacter scottomollicae TaxID=483013 RepID=A0A2T1ALG3_TRISK|nr:hypothetical protein CLV89_102134 [Tritonibacter scottomollicae]
MYDPVQKRTRRKYDGFSCEFNVIRKNYAGDLVLPFHNEVNNFTFDNVKISLFFGGPKHFRFVYSTISLGARSLHSRTFPTIQKSELDTCEVRDAAHYTVQRIDFSDEMSFSQATNCRIAGHDTNTITAERYHSSSGAHSCCSMGCFGSGMPAAYDDDIVMRMFHVKHSLLS